MPLYLDYWYNCREIMRVSQKFHGTDQDSPEIEGTGTGRLTNDLRYIYLRYELVLRGHSSNRNNFTTQSLAVIKRARCTQASPNYDPCPLSQ